MAENIIMHNDFCEVLTANTKKEAPILQLINCEMSDQVCTKSGDTVNVALPDYGVVTEGASFYNDDDVYSRRLGTIEALNVKQTKVPVTLKQYKIGYEMSDLDKSLKLFNKEEQVEATRTSNLARTINADVFRTVLSAAHSAIVGEIGFVELGDAISYVDESRVGDSTAGMLSPLLNNSIVQSGNMKFANSTLGTNLYKGLLGNYQDAEFVKSADAGSLKLGATYAQQFAFSGRVNAIKDGDDELVLTGLTFGGSTLAVIPKGTPICIGSADATVPGSTQTPFTMANVYSEDTQINRTFVAVADAAITNGTARVKIAPVWLKTKIGDVVTKSEAAIANTVYTGNAAQTATMPCFCPLFAGAKYALGCVFASKCVAFASGILKPFVNFVSNTSTLEGELNIRSSIWSEGADAKEGWRLDVLYGCAPLYGAGSVALYAKIG